MRNEEAMKEKSLTKFQKYKKTLTEISTFGKGIPEASIDWAQIGKNAVYAAQEALKEKCRSCGRVKP